MLANGTLLGMKKPGTAEFVDIPDLKTVPDMNNEKEKVENTRLSAANKQYEYGVGDYGDLEYTFVHTENKEGSAYRMLREYSDSNTPVEFKETWTDGTPIQRFHQSDLSVVGEPIRLLILLSKWHCRVTLFREILHNKL